jgi:uncharacterized membrane protein
MVLSIDTAIKDIAVHYLHLLRARVTATTIQKDIDEHPYYPSLLSLSETFSKYNISNDAFEIDKADLDGLDAPFVAYVGMPSAGKDFVLVTKMDDQTVSFLHKGKRTRSMSKEEFLKRFRDIVWLAETNEGSGEENYIQKQKEERTRKKRTLFWYLSLALLFGCAIYMNVGSAALPALASMALLKMIGGGATILLLGFEIDKNSGFVKELCGAGAKVNCEAVLESKFARIGRFSWAEIGFFYFASTGLYLLFAGGSFSNKAGLLSLANILAAPYVVYSLYYQWRVIKQWCPLCLTVQAVLVLELFWGIANVWRIRYPLSLFPDRLAADLLSAAFWFLFVCISWYGLKPLLLKARDAGLFSSAYKRLQYHPEIFKSFLLQQPKAPDGWGQIGIPLGNPNASNTIIKVCNPYCAPCARAHRELEDLVNRNSDIQVRIIFISKNIENDRQSIVVKHLLAITAQSDVAGTQQALDDWYLPMEKNYDRFAARHPVNGELDRQGEKLEAMSNWCEEAGVVSTPTVFINGFKLPENYTIAELKNIF